MDYILYQLYMIFPKYSLLISFDFTHSPPSLSLSPSLPPSSLRGMSEAEDKIKNGRDVPRRFSKEQGSWERLLVDLAATNPSFKGIRNT